MKTLPESIIAENRMSDLKEKADKLQAEYWLRRAAEAGDKDAQERLLKLKNTY